MKIHFKLNQTKGGILIKSWGVGNLVLVQELLAGAIKRCFKRFRNLIRTKIFIFN